MGWPGIFLFVDGRVCLGGPFYPLVAVPSGEQGWGATVKSSWFDLAQKVDRQEGLVRTRTAIWGPAKERQHCGIADLMDPANQPIIALFPEKAEPGRAPAPLAGMTVPIRRSEWTRAVSHSHNSSCWPLYLSWDVLLLMKWNISLFRFFSNYLDDNHVLNANSYTST